MSPSRSHIVMMNEDNTDSNEDHLPYDVDLVDIEGKRKKQYVTIEQKISFVLEAERLVKAEKKMSWKSFCKERGIDPSNLRKWSRNVVKMKQTLDQTRAKKSKVSLSTGRPSSISDIAPRLISWIKALRSNGITVSVRMASIRAIRFRPCLRKKKRHTLYAVVRRLMRANNIGVRKLTHKAQAGFDGTVDTALRFVQGTRPFFAQSNRHPAFILNMDQTPYNVNDPPNETLNERGAKTVNGKAPKSSVGRITANLCVAADGTKLPLMLVFKGKHDAKVSREVRRFPVICETQDNAWCDERVMLSWIDRVLKPYISTAPDGVVPYLLLDDYKTHKTKEVCKRLDDLGVEWDLIPPGCTGLSQPVDIGIGKPWKSRVRFSWESYMVDNIEENSSLENLKPHEVRKLIAKWAQDAWDKLPNEIVFNAWRHGDYSYFPNDASKKVSYNFGDFGYDDDDEGDDEIEGEELSNNTEV